MAEQESSYEPLYDRVLVRRVEESETQTGGIIIPDAAKDKPQQGVVIKVGFGRRDALRASGFEPLIVQAGDEVLFGKYAGTEIKIDGETVLILREEEILLRKPKTQVLRSAQDDIYPYTVDADRVVL